MIRAFFRLIILVVPFVFGCASGPSSEFSCKDKDMPAGTVCNTPSEVYDMTNDKDRVSAQDQADTPVDKSTPGTTTQDSPWNYLEPRTGPKPLLQPARVLRVWIAPWVDEAENLHWPGFVFTEITPRQWSFGEQAARKAPAIVPLQLGTTKPRSVNVRNKSRSTQSRQAAGQYLPNSTLIEEMQP